VAWGIAHHRSAIKGFLRGHGVVAWNSLFPQVVRASMAARRSPLHPCRRRSRNENQDYDCSDDPRALCFPPGAVTLDTDHMVGCAGSVVPVRSTTWSTVKSYYR
jgi:hypothetical protein